jgi:hypothetical protein
VSCEAEEVLEVCEVSGIGAVRGPSEAVVTVIVSMGMVLFQNNHIAREK